MLHAVLVLLPLLVAVVGACSSAGDSDADGLGGSVAAPGASGTSGDGGATTTAAVEDIELQADDFVRLQDMTPVRGFFVDNRLGHLDEALAVANDPDGGGAYPFDLTASARLFVADTDADDAAEVLYGPPGGR